MDVLIGSGEDGPVAVETIFECVLSGPIERVQESISLLSAHTDQDPVQEPELDGQLDLERFWELGVESREASVYRVC